MDSITIKKNGTLIKKEGFDKNVKETEIKKLSEYLSYELILEEGVNLEDIITILLKEKTFFNKLFKPDMNKFKLNDLKHIMDNGKTKKVKNGYGETLLYLEISKTFELLSYKDDTNSIDLFPLFIGVGKSVTGDKFEDLDEVFMPIGLISISNFKHLPIVLQKNVELFRADSEGNLSLLLTATAPLSVYEALSAILYEITYFGTEEEKIKQLKDASQQKNTNDKVEDLEIYLQELVDSEQYEKAARVKKDLDKLKKMKKKSK